MAQFVITDDTDRDVRIITVQGQLSFRELLEQAVANFEVEKPAFYLLWDFSAAELDDLSTPDLRDLIHRMAPLTEQRSGAKSALVMSRDLEFGLGRMMEVYAEMEHFKLEGRVFRTREEAEAWLLA